MSVELVGNLSLDWIWWWLRAALLVSAFAIFAGELLRERRATNEMRRELGREFAATRKQVADLADRLAAIGTAIATLAANQEVERSTAVGMSPKMPATRGGYEVAIRLARSGASAEELMASSGATRAEAELLCRLHGADAGPRDGDHITRRMATLSHAKS